MNTWALIRDVTADVTWTVSTYLHPPNYADHHASIVGSSHFVVFDLLWSPSMALSAVNSSLVELYYAELREILLVGDAWEHPVASGPSSMTPIKERNYALSWTFWDFSIWTKVPFRSQSITDL